MAVMSSVEVWGSTVSSVVDASLVGRASVQL